MKQFRTSPDIGFRVISLKNGMRMSCNSIEKKKRTSPDIGSRVIRESARHLPLIRSYHITPHPRRAWNPLLHLHQMLLFRSYAAAVQLGNVRDTDAGERTALSGAVRLGLAFPALDAVLLIDSCIVHRCQMGRCQMGITRYFSTAFKLARRQISKDWNAEGEVVYLQNEPRGQETGRRGLQVEP